ncbi:TPA: single-stranded DNA-binding protein [Campylobacter jejuni]|nr:single-stranded DNA-binding protein [Campylobacter jejuni]ECP9572318.1 single-stranded DNA-binding protein [Campylobacter jejuni]ECQ5760049.1 single-stranded DNA-binding protein [Campylobacter jejuni]HED4933222.1 single-stranded DNA-binding protein [Campylobacter jejuni]HEF3328596.1 single-stranded DNA-binding protein [Campylobacter jejuni]
MNNVNLIGYLGKDFEIGTTNSGRIFAKNSLAITKRWKNERGNEESSTTWIPIVLFGKSAESASTHIKKGSQFACSGELSSNQYQDEDGTQNPQIPPKEPNIDYENTNIESEETQVF